MEQIEKYFGRTSIQNYDAFLVPALIFPATQKLIDMARPRSGHIVLDVACGTGVVARNVAPKVGMVGKVIGLDIYPEMLEMARSLAQQEGVSINWHQGDVINMPFGDATYDVALCQQGLQWFPDRLAALQEIHRILKRDGRLAISVFTHIEDTPGYAILVDAIQRYVGEEATVSRRDIFSLSESAEIQRLLAVGGFKDITIEAFTYLVRFPSPEEFLRQEIASWSDRVTFSLNEREKQAFLSDVKAALQAYCQEEGIVFPSRTNIALAIK